MLEIKVGDVFGKWEVLSNDPEDKNCFICKCQCRFGTTQSMIRYKLLDKYSYNQCKKCKSDVLKDKIKIGEKFGHWTVLEIKYYGTSNICYVCECDCEFKTKRTILSYLLKTKNVRSCKKCAGKRKNFGSRTGEGTVTGAYFSRLRQNAYSRNLSFLITVKDIYKQYLEQRSYCYLTGLYLVFTNYNNVEQTASVDRTDNYFGYTVDNIKICHKDINKIRYYYTKEELLYFCQLIIQNIHKKYEPIDYKCPNRSNKWRGFGDISKTNWYQIERRAKKSNRQIDIDIEYGWELAKKQRFRCALTGLSLAFGYKSQCNASLDRIDSEKGYIKGNVQWIRKEIQSMKWDFHDKYFKYLCRQVYENEQLAGNIFSFI